MIFNGVKCDMCGDILTDIEEVAGIKIEEDLFDRLKSFPFVTDNVLACPVHVCVECFRIKVVIAAENACPRRNGQEAHQLEVGSRSYLLRVAAVANYRKERDKILSQAKKNRSKSLFMS